MGVLWTIALSTALITELRRFQARLGAVGGWVFRAARASLQIVNNLRWKSGPQRVQHGENVDDLL
jgi:hypothetical protein